MFSLTIAFLIVVAYAAILYYPEVNAWLRIKFPRSYRN